MENHLIEPMIPVRLNPVLSTLDAPIFEDDERQFLPEPPHAENLKIGMDFYDPTTDKYIHYVQQERFRMGLPPIEISPIPTATVNTEKLPENAAFFIQDNLPITSVGSANKHGFSALQNSDTAEKVTLRFSKRRPIDVAEDLLTRFQFRVYENSLYFYKGSCYEYISKDEFKTLFMQIALAAVKENGHTYLSEEVYDFLIHTPHIQIEEGKIPKNLIAFENRLFDVYGFKPVPSTPEKFTTFQLKCNFIEYFKPCNNFENFLRTITGGNEDLTVRIWEFLGYCLTPDTSAKKIFILQGLGNSGKSVLSNLIKSFFPKGHTLHCLLMIWKRISLHRS